QAALRGLDLNREHTAPASVAAEAGHGAKDLAGLYSPNVDADATTGARTHPASITLYDSAFPSGPDSRQSSIHTVLHEAGHAVEALRGATTPTARDAARTRLDSAIAARDTALSAMSSGHPARSAAEDLARSSGAWSGAARSEGDARVTYTQRASDETAARRA